MQYILFIFIVFDDIRILTRLVAFFLCGKQMTKFVCQWLRLDFLCAAPPPIESRITRYTLSVSPFVRPSVSPVQCPPLTRKLKTTRTSNLQERLPTSRVTWHSNLMEGRISCRLHWPHLLFLYTSAHHTSTLPDTFTLYFTQNRLIDS